MHASEQVRAPQGEFHSRMCPRSERLNPILPPICPNGEKQNKLILAPADLGLSTDAAICILQAHIFCRLISIFTISATVFFPAHCAI